ncbi:MAG: hypothetical protein LBP28_06945 [Coriobacteriales bacterium]|jgi:putative Mn2+ efflux pump MntP|nr:hypothetical protein [Coriobacteriales bacterium]
MTDQQKTHQKDQDAGSTGFIAAWTLLIMLGLAVEFFGRLLGYEGNPLAVHYPWAAMFAGMAAVVIVLAGYFTLAGKQAKQSTMSRRKGVLLLTLGAFMLAGFFIFKQVIPQIFG